jgi:hypothetical protein
VVFKEHRVLKGFWALKAFKAQPVCRGRKVLQVRKAQLVLTVQLDRAVLQG